MIPRAALHPRAKQTNLKLVVRFLLPQTSHTTLLQNACVDRAAVESSNRRKSISNRKAVLNRLLEWSVDWRGLEWLKLKLSLGQHHCQMPGGIHGLLSWRLSVLMSCSITGDSVGFRPVQSPSTEVHVIPQDLGVVWFFQVSWESLFCL